jgi:6,7-dimethyl-8-ribityllumazine synthase
MPYPSCGSGSANSLFPHLRKTLVNTVQGTLSAEGIRFGIVISRFNSLVTQRLLEGALDCLVRHGADVNATTVVYCPGAFEIPQVAQTMAKSGRFDALISLGCVIRGDTPHFDYIAAEVAKGIGQVGLSTNVPIAFGVLTTETLEQALERAGAKSGNKGWDAALTAIELVQIGRQLSGASTKTK